MSQLCEGGHRKRDHDDEGVCYGRREEVGHGCPCRAYRPSDGDAVGVVVGEGGWHSCRKRDSIVHHINSEHCDCLRLPKIEIYCPAHDSGDIDLPPIECGACLALNRPVSDGERCQKLVVGTGPGGDYADLCDNRLPCVDHPAVEACVCEGHEHADCMGLWGHCTCLWMESRGITPEPAPPVGRHEHPADTCFHPIAESKETIEPCGVSRLLHVDLNHPFTGPPADLRALAAKCRDESQIEIKDDIPENVTWA